MSSTDSSSEASSFVSENEYESEFDEISDVESGECSKSIEGQTSSNAMAASSDNDSYAWADDPVAEDEWTERRRDETARNFARNVDETFRWLYATFGLVSFDINKQTI